MKPLNEEEAILRAFMTWNSYTGLPGLCRTWCTAELVSPATWRVYLRDDELTLLGIYQVGPKRLRYLANETELAQAAEWVCLNQARINQGEDR